MKDSLVNDSGLAESLDEGTQQSSVITDVRAGLERWSHQMDLYTGPDALLDFNQIDYVHIDLTGSNPSGLAQLMMGRNTRLSTILRDKSKLEHGMQAARALRTKIFELETHHGLDAGYLVAGTASWLSRDVYEENGMASEKRFIAPVLLVPISITPHPTSDDFELRLSGTAKLNPAMVRQLKKEYGVDLSKVDVVQLANSMSKLDPEPVIDRLRAVSGSIPGMMVESKYLISTFADLKVSTIELPSTAYTPLIRELADLAFTTPNERHIPPFVMSTSPSVDEKDPADELLVLDADETVSEIIDLAKEGHSLVITAAPGTEPLHAVVNMASNLAAQGKSVLIVGEKRSTLHEFQALLQRIDLSEIALDLLADSEPEGLRESMVRAIVRNEQAAAPRLQDLHAQLREARSKLANHTASLKYTESRWGCSVYDSLQTLAALTEQEPTPATRVRFSRFTMDELVDRTEAAANLKRLGELSAFKPSTQYSPWRKAKLLNTKECEDALSLVRSLYRSVVNLQIQMRQMSLETGMREGATIAEWDAQLGLLERIRETLTKFRPAVYDRPVTDLIAATASGTWRREHGIEMSSIQRSRLRKAAKEYMLPNIHLNDLHENLLIVQGEREEWISWSENPREPLIPANLNQLRVSLTNLVSELSGLQIVLADSPEGNEFITVPVVGVATRLESLLGDERLLRSLPERVRLTDQLSELGLDDFMADMLERQIEPEHIQAELELAWWQSALELMLASSEIDILDGDTLRSLEASFRTADAAHVASGPARVISAISDLWKKRIVEDSHGAAYLKSQLTGHEFKFMDLLTHAPGMVGALFPLWISSPFALARKLPATARFDTVILLDAESTPLAANLSAITRANQVIALGDPHSGFPAPFMVCAVAHGAPLKTDSTIVSTFDALSRLLPHRSLSLVNRAVDPASFSYLNSEFYRDALTSYPWGEEYTHKVQGLTIEYLDTLGKVSDNANLDSPSVEVQRVAERVFEHAYKNPGQSLAVVTASVRHAQRIAEEVRHMLALYPQLADFFAPGAEPFRVVDLSRAAGLERDVIIFSLGIGKSQRGVAAHAFGQLSGEHGRHYFVLGMTRARHLTKIISCVSPLDLDPDRLENGARDMYRVMKQYADFQEAKEAKEAVQPLTDKIPTNEFLRNSDIEAIDMGDWLMNDLVRRLLEQKVELIEPQQGGMSLIALAESESLLAGSTLSPRVRKSSLSQQAEGIRFPLSVWSDGSDSYCALSVRERTRLIPERLARTGWNVMTLWTIEVFSNPQAVVDRMCLFLGIEKDAA